MTGRTGNSPADGTDAVLVMAYGTPRSREEILPYYTDIRRGRPPTDALLAELTERYEAIGGLSPLARLTDAQCSGLQRALDEPYLSTLASPLTGGGIELGWRTLLALGAWRAGAKDAVSIAASVASTLARLGHPFVHEGVVIKDSAEASSMLRREAESFLERRLPKLKALLS